MTSLKQTKMELQETDVINNAREYKERNYEELQGLGLGLGLIFRVGARVRDRVRKRVGINVPCSLRYLVGPKQYHC